MLPLFDQSAGGLRLKTLIDLMGELGWKLVFGSLALREESPGILSTPSGLASYENALRRSGVTRCVFGVDEISVYLKETGRGLDMVFLSFPHVTNALLPLVRTHCPVASIVYDMVDFHGLRMSRQADVEKNEPLRKEAEKQRAIEVACARSADLTLAINEEERAAMLALAPEAVIEVMPNVFHMPEHAPAGVEARKDLLFIGGFWHKPNGDAVAWFVDRIWPLVRSAEPDVISRIVGSNPSNEVLALGAQPGIEVLGYVPDVAPLLESHRVSIAPLRWGAGTKGKVGQALSHGLPVVATPIGAEGMALRDGEHLLVAEDERGFAQHVIELLRDDELWRRLSLGGREHMATMFSTHVIKHKLDEVLRG
ncbi:Glycosyl transferases group 1 [Variovorax sp. OV329]|nr:Glycosyl transferases group 1 [Variovorax sp. OV329]